MTGNNQPQRFEVLAEHEYNYGTSTGHIRDREEITEAFLLGVEALPLTLEKVIKTGVLPHRIVGKAFHYKDIAGMSEDDYDWGNALLFIGEDPEDSGPVKILQGRAGNEFRLGQPAFGDRIFLRHGIFHVEEVRLPGGKEVVAPNPVRKLCLPAKNTPKREPDVNNPYENGTYHAYSDY